MDAGGPAAAAAAAVAAGDAKGLDKNTLVAVLQFLNKNNLQVSLSAAGNNTLLEFCPLLIMLDSKIF